MRGWTNKRRGRRTGQCFLFFSQGLYLFFHIREAEEQARACRRTDRKKERGTRTLRTREEEEEEESDTTSPKRRRERKKGELCEALVLEGAEEVLGDGRKGRAVNLCVATGALWLGGDGGDLLGETASAKDVRAVGLDGVEEHVVANGAKQLAVGVRAEWEDEGHGRGALVALCGRNERRGGSRKR